MNAELTATESLPRPPSPVNGIHIPVDPGARLPDGPAWRVEGDTAR
jgi:hypothetical protein